MTPAAGLPIRVRDVPARRGAAWLAGGWQLFRRKPWAWIGLAAGWMVITLGLVMVPLVGGVVANLLQPVFFAGFALAAHRQRAGQSIDTGSLFAGWALVGWDLWRRDDLDPGARVGWAVVAFLLVWIGIVAYWLFRPRGVTPGERARQQQASDEFVARHTRPPE